jgi:hypothetical protein
MKITRARWIVASLALIIIVVAWIIFQATRSESYTKTDETRARIRLIMDSVDRYMKLKGRFPTQEEGFGVLIEEQLLGPKATVDPWGQAIVYICRVPDCSKVVVYSKGPNGIDEAGKGDDISMEQEKAAGAH